MSVRSCFLGIRLNPSTNVHALTAAFELKDLLSDSTRTWETDWTPRVYSKVQRAFEYCIITIIGALTNDIWCLFLGNKLRLTFEFGRFVSTYGMGCLLSVSSGHLWLHGVHTVHWGTVRLRTRRVYAKFCLGSEHKHIAAGYYFNICVITRGWTRTHAYTYNVHDAHVYAVARVQTHLSVYGTVYAYVNYVLRPYHRWWIRWNV